MKVRDVEAFHISGEEYLGYYYDEESNRVWYNEELFQKHQAYLNSDKGKGTI